MSSYSASLSVEQLGDRFQVERCPYWFVYNASRSKEMMAKFREDSDTPLTKDELMAESWTQLEYFLITHPGGHGRVVLKGSPSANVSTSPQLYVKWGSVAENKGSVAGIGNSSPNNNATMIDKLLKMQERHFEQRMADKDRLIELVLENRNLESAVEGLQEPSMQEELLKGGIEIAKTIFGSPRPTPSLGTAGDGSFEQSKPESNNSAKGRPFSIDQALSDLGVVRKNLSDDHHINDVVRALALLFHQKPQEANTYVSMLINQVNNG